MNVVVRILFTPPTESDRASLLSLGRTLTNNPQSVRLFAQDDDPQWLVVEFTMPTEAQYKAVDKIDYFLRFHVLTRMDSIIQFPKSAAEQARAQRKAERRRARRSQGAGGMENDGAC